MRTTSKYSTITIMYN